MKRIGTTQGNKKNITNLDKEKNKQIDFIIQTLTHNSSLAEISRQANLIYSSLDNNFKNNYIKMNKIKNISTKDNIIKQLQIKKKDLDQILHTPRGQIVRDNEEKNIIKLVSPYYNSNMIEYRHLQQNLLHQIALKQTMKMIQENDTIFNEGTEEINLQGIKDYYDIVMQLLNHDLNLNLALLLMQARPENITFLYNESNIIDPTETVQAINSAILLPIEQIAQTKKGGGDLFFSENKDKLADKIKELSVNKKVTVIDTTVEGNADFKIPTTPMDLIKYNNKNYKILLVEKDFINNEEMQQKYMKELEKNEELETFVLITDSSNLYKNNDFVNNLNLFKGKLQEMQKFDQLDKLKDLYQFEIVNKKQFFDKLKTFKKIDRIQQYAKKIEKQLNEIIPDSDIDYVQSNFDLTIENQLNTQSKKMKKEIISKIAEALEKDTDL